jgi:hypothetical protein
MRISLALITIAAVPQVAINVPESFALLIWGAILFAAARGLRARVHPSSATTARDNNNDAASITGVLARG